MPWIVTPLLLGLTFAGDKPATGEIVLLKHCEVAYERTTTLGAFVILQAGGRVQDCYVQPGDRVNKGQVLARLHDRDAVVELERLRNVSESDIDVRLGEAKHAVALAKLKRAESLLAKALVSVEEVQLDRLDVKTAALEIEQARRRRCSDALSTRRMEAEVRSREIVVPHDGVVVEIVKNVGESCICNEAVMRIVADDRVRVTGFLDVGDSWKVRLGHRVRMFVVVEGAEVAIEREVFFGASSSSTPGSTR